LVSISGISRSLKLNIVKSVYLFDLTKTRKISIYILILYSVLGCKPQIDIVPDAKACFSYDSINKLTIDTLMFTNCSENSETYLWSFGDGNYSKEATPKHNYSSPGLYTVKLIANNKNSSDSITQIIKIMDYAKAKACFNTDSPYYEEGNSIYYLLKNNTASIQFNNCSENATSYLWHFGYYIYGNSEETNPSNIYYTTEGIYKVKLIANNLNSSDTIVKTLYFINSLRASFSVKSIDKFKMSFKSYDFYIKNFNSYYWNFGDGTFSTETDPEHQYSSAGNYTVTLTISNKYETKSTTKQVICTLFNFPLSIDIDNDNVNELTTHEVILKVSKGGQDFKQIIPVNGLEISSVQNGYGCKLYENGATVEDSTFRSNGKLYLYYSDYWYNFSTGVFNGFEYNGLVGLGPKYLVFRKKYGSVYKYGWIRMSIPESGSYYNGIVYGYSAPKEYYHFIIDDIK